MLDNSALIAQLTALNVQHLRSLTAADARNGGAPGDLITALAHHPDPRFREALIPLFLRQPQLSTLVPSLTERLDASAADVLRHMYTAAVFLQRLWHSVLKLYLGDYALLPDYFGHSHYGLPAPDEYFGELGLNALADLYCRRTGYDWLSVYKSVMTLFLEQLSLSESAYVQPIH